MRHSSALEVIKSKMSFTILAGPEKYMCTYSAFVLVAQEWELTTLSGKTYCLQHLANSTSYCYFSDIGHFKIKYVKIGCTRDNNIIHPDTCIPFLNGGPNGKRILKKDNLINTTRNNIVKCPVLLRVLICVQIADEQTCTKSGMNSKGLNYQSNSKITPLETKPKKNIVKRSAQIDSPDGDYPAYSRQQRPEDHPPSGSFSEDEDSRPGMEVQARSGSDDFEGDEDFIEPIQASIKNDPILMEHLGAYVEGEIGEILGNRGPYSSDRRYPVLKLLESSLEVMKVSV